MDTILVSSGYRDATLERLRQHWHVIDIPDHAEALAHLRQCAQLPMAVAIGFGSDPAAPDGRGPRFPAQHLLPQILALDPDLPVIISTRRSQPAAIVDLIKRGAFDYVVEAPRDDDGQDLARYTQDLVHALSRAAQWRRTILENRRLKRAGLNAGGDAGGDVTIQARSPAMLRALELVQKVAPTPATVLITGESGTGKELIARAIHHASPRRDEPFVAVNCSALSESLLASELFGHVKGAFTGADADHTGLIRQAGEGTLFLDEIATVPSAFQVMLLRVLEERLARPVGAQREYPVRCRFIAAANRDVGQLVQHGDFREDLYYRLNVFHIDVPPLRQRPEDVPVLAQHFLRQAATQFGKDIAGFEPAAMQRLEQHGWSGNVRQLRNVVERAVILCEGRRITAGDVAPELGDGPGDALATIGRGYHDTMREFETRLLRQALQRAGGNRSRAARLLNMKRTTLNYRLRQLELT